MLTEADLPSFALDGETYVRPDYAGRGLANVAPTVLRFSTLFGSSPRMRFDLTVNEFTMEMLVHRRLVIYGEQFWRPYLHIRDAARAIELVLGQPSERVDQQVYNVGDNRENYQKRQLADLIRAQIGDEVEIQSVRRDEDPRDYRVSFDKIRKEMGFAVTRRVPDGVQELISVIGQRVITDFANPWYRN